MDYLTPKYKTLARVKVQHQIKIDMRLTVPLIKNTFFFLRKLFLLGKKSYNLVVIVSYGELNRAKGYYYLWAICMILHKPTR